MSPEEFDFPEGLSLRLVTYAEVNFERKPYEALKTWPVELDVPLRTKAVHVAVTCVEITPGTTENPTPSPLGRVGFEITNRDTSKLEIGKFSCEFRAVFEGGGGTVPWTGYFVLEVLCFS